MIILLGLATSLSLWILWLLFGFESNLDKNKVECRAEALRSIRRINAITGMSRQSKQIRILQKIQIPVFQYVIVQLFKQKGHSFTKSRHTIISPFMLEGKNEVGNLFIIRICQENRLLRNAEVESLKRYCEEKDIFCYYIHLGYIPVRITRNCNPEKFKIISGSKIIKYLTS